VPDPDLYALPPEEFTAARTAAVEAARAAGEAGSAKHLGALRRPSASAYVVNQLVRRSPDLLDQLLDLGRALAAAQASGAGDALRELGAQRRDLVAAVAAQGGQRQRTPGHSGGPPRGRADAGGGARRSGLG
jgi:hypothetical protein